MEERKRKIVIDTDEDHEVFTFPGERKDKAFTWKMKGAHAPRPPRPPRPPRGFGFSFGTDCDIQMEHDVIQKVEDDTLVCLFTMPGIDKTSLKVRAKTDTLVVSADRAEDYIPYFGKSKLEKRIRLAEEVDSGSAKAKYSDGILKVTFQLSDPGEEVQIEE